MRDILTSFISSFSGDTTVPGPGTAEFFVAVLVACGLAMIAISSLLPKGKTSDLEWWER